MTQSALGGTVGTLLEWLEERVLFPAGKVFTWQSFQASWKVLSQPSLAPRFCEARIHSRRRYADTWMMQGKASLAALTSVLWTLTHMQLSTEVSLTLAPRS